MALAAGTRLGAYEVLTLIGVGGMGEVYRARDARLGRDVAIKILPTDVAADAERLQRFELEARATAALNHPNILAIFDIGNERGIVYVVSELLDGETLRAVLARDALPVRRATEYAIQIADGLAVAHDKGIVHRDLKPENVFVTRDGRIKILDFGLAKLRGPLPTPADGISAAVTRPLDTAVGAVLGTVGYMSPEQVRGFAVDHRADIFSLGGIVYEMLAGRRAFTGDSAVGTLNAILTADPAELTVNTTVPPALDRVVRRCLEKNADERFQSARDVAFALEALSGSASGVASAQRLHAPGRSRERWSWATAVVVTALVATWLGATIFTRPRAPELVAHRLILPMPDGVTLESPIGPLRLAVSPNGQWVAFVGSTRDHNSMWIQSLIDRAAHELKGTAGAGGPAWSPDGQHVLFATSGFGGPLKMIDVDGGSTIDLGPVGVGRWGTRNDIIATTGPPEWTVRYLAGPHAAPSALLRPSQDGEQFYASGFLPDGQHVLIWHRLSTGRARIEIAALSGGEPQVLLEFADLGAAALASGSLLYSRGGRLFAQSFDSTGMRLLGEPIAIADRLDTSPLGAAFSVSTNGVLVYASSLDEPKSRLTWFDRAGHMQSTLADDADYSNVELSPDGQRLALSVTDPAKDTRDIYIVDVGRGVRQRLTFDPSDERSAVWSPDGRQIIYNSKGLDLYRRPSDFADREEPLLTDHASKDPRHVSSDGRLLLYRRTGTSTGNDIWMMTLDGDRKATPVIETPFNENYANFSPDDRSIVYVSNESGRPEVYVVSREGGGRTQLSTSGGSFPRWRRDGHEILYLAADQTMMSVEVSGSGRAFHASSTKPLFKVDVQGGAGVPFDVTADGQRLLVNARIRSRLPPSWNVVINWPALLSKH